MCVCVVMVMVMVAYSSSDFWSIIWGCCPNGEKGSGGLQGIHHRWPSGVLWVCCWLGSHALVIGGVSSPSPTLPGCVSSPLPAWMCVLSLILLDVCPLLYPPGCVSSPLSSWMCVLSPILLDVCPLPPHPPGCVSPPSPPSSGGVHLVWCGVCAGR